MNVGAKASDQMKLIQKIQAQQREKERRLQEILGNKPKQLVPLVSDIPTSNTDLLRQAKIAVDIRKSQGKTKTSPEVWAAVQILSQFVERSDNTRWELIHCQCSDNKRTNRVTTDYKPQKLTM